MESPYTPQSPEEARQLLLPQIESVITTVHSLPQELRAARQIYMEARLLPNYMAAGQFPDMLINGIGAIAVGSRADRALYQTRTRQFETGTRRVVLAIEDSGLELLSSLVTTRGNNRSEQQAFEEIRKLDQVTIPEADSIVRGHPEDLSERITWEAILHPMGRRGSQLLPLDEETLRKWFTLIRQENGQVHENYIRRAGGLTFTPITMTDQAALAVAHFNPLRALRPMPTIRPTPRVTIRSAPQLQPPTDPTPRAFSPTVAVFDGGVEKRDPQVLFPRSTVDLTDQSPIRDLTDHGTGVTGAVLCGLAGPGERAVQPPLPVDSFRVLPPPPPVDLEIYWILDQIKDAVLKSGAKIVNLSLGPSEAVEDTMEPNRWTSELDQLAWENDVLFVIAAGNDGDKDRATGLHRVQVPGDMANGLTVGACDVEPPRMPWTRAPYSSMGPGRSGNRIQPIGVQFGGCADRPFPVLRSDGTFRDSAGTSFATPLVTHALAELATRLPEVNPNILRAFAVHFAERHRTYRRLREEVGYGRLPLSFANHLECAPNEVHVLYVDEITRGDLLGYQVPIPVSSGAVEIRVTLAYASTVEPTQPTEYTNASLELAFRPHHQRYRFRPPTGESGSAIELDYTSDDARNLLAAGWQPGQEPITKGLGTAERTPENQLRDSGKWETLRHARINLKAGDAAEPRLEVSYLARRAGGLDNSPTAVPFALLITVIDNSGAADLYDRAARQFASLRPVQPIRARLRVQGT